MTVLSTLPEYAFNILIYTYVGSISSNPSKRVKTKGPLVRIIKSKFNYFLKITALTNSCKILSLIVLKNFISSRATDQKICFTFSNNLSISLIWSNLPRI